MNINFDKLLYMNEYFNELEMKKTNFLYAMELTRDYATKNSNNDNNESFLANYIHYNYHHLDDVELKYMALKLLSENDARHIVLKYELNHFRYNPKVMTLDQFQESAIKILQRYQHKAGGFLLEDIDWNIYRENSVEYDLKENEMAFINTIASCDENDNETEEYLSALIEMLQSLVSNIKVEIKSKAKDKHIELYIFVQIKCAL